MEISKNLGRKTEEDDEQKPDSRVFSKEDTLEIFHIKIWLGWKNKVSRKGETWGRGDLTVQIKFLTLYYAKYLQLY